MMHEVATSIEFQISLLLFVALGGFLLAPRGEVVMIVALLGLNSDVIAQPSYITLVLMSLLTTLVTPLLLRNWLYRSEFRVSSS